MAQYYYSQYSVVTSKTYTKTLIGQTHGNIGNGFGWTSFRFDAEKGLFYPAGSAESWAVWNPTIYTMIGTDGATSMTEFTYKMATPGDSNSYTSYTYSYTVTQGNPTRGSLITTFAAENGTYPSNGVQNGYWYVRGAAVNTAPTTPTLTVPSTQFEHGDKHIIGFSSTDAEGNAITYTLQASYNSGAWENLYVGIAKTFEYTVPSNKGANVKFRVTASDGSLSSTSAESVVKTIRAVMYYWNKYNNSYVPASSAPGALISTAWVDQHTVMGSEYSGKEYYIGGRASGDRYIKEWWMPTGSPYHRLYQEIYALVSTPARNAIGALIQNNIQAEINAYVNNALNSDGFWYVRNQRVLSADVTPPIIELEEQTTSAPTSTITVKTHDLGTVSTVKWAKGEHAVAYFATAGQSIPTGQTTPSSFTVSENGKYTVYAEDNRSNKAVAVINVVKVNTKPAFNRIETKNIKRKESIVIDLSEHVQDSDGDDLYFAAASADNSICTATVEGTLLTLKGERLGTTQIQVTANDGKESVTESFSVTILNNKPSFALVMYKDDLDASLVDTPIKITRERGVSFIVAVDDKDEEDKLSLTARANNEVIKTIESIEKNKSTTIDIGSGSLSFGMNLISFKVSDGQEETTFNVSVIVDPNVPIGYACLSHMKFNGYAKSTVSLAELTGHLEE